MAVNGKHFAFIWRIKNISFGLNTKNLFSPSFSVKALGGTEWHLILNINQDNVSCRIRRENDSGPNDLQIDHELSFLARDGSLLRSEVFKGKIFKKGYYDSGSELGVKKVDIFKHNPDLYISDDTLTIQCRMWDSNDTISQASTCFAETLIETQCRSFIGTIDKFSSRNLCQEHLVHIQSASVNNFFSSINFCETTDGKLELGLKPLDYNHLYKYKCKVFVLNESGKKVISGQGEFHGTKLEIIPLAITKKQLLEKKECYLPNDVLTIECEIINPTGSTKEKDVWIPLFNKGLGCDAELKTATETFQVHKAVLVARSPVFKSMLNSDMKERVRNCVSIDDLDSVTVRRMLKFMYTDTLDDLDYDSVKSLCNAADKYDITSLRNECSSYLEQKFSQSKSCDTLLADKHQGLSFIEMMEEYRARQLILIQNSESIPEEFKHSPWLTIGAIGSMDKIYSAVLNAYRHLKTQ